MLVRLLRARRGLLVENLIKRQQLAVLKRLLSEYVRSLEHGELLTKGEVLQGNISEIGGPNEKTKQRTKQQKRAVEGEGRSCKMSIVFSLIEFWRRAGCYIDSLAVDAVLRGRGLPTGLPLQVALLSRPREKFQAGCHAGRVILRVNPGPSEGLPVPSILGKEITRLEQTPVPEVRP